MSPPANDVQLNQNAPKLHVTLDLISYIVLSDTLEVVVKARYEVEKPARPITFHAPLFQHGNRRMKREH